MTEKRMTRKWALPRIVRRPPEKGSVKESCGIFGAIPALFLSVILTLEMGLFLSEQIHLLPTGKGISVLVCVGLGLLSTFVAIIYLIVTLWHRPQFYLGRKVIVLQVVVIAIPFAWMATSVFEARRQRQAVDTFVRMGFLVEYAPVPEGFSRFLSSMWPTESAPTQVTLLHRLLGADFFAEVHGISNGLPGATSKEQLSYLGMGSLRALPDIRSISIDYESGFELASSQQNKDRTNNDVTGFGLETLKTLADLRSLTLLNNRKINDAALAHLRESYELRSLHILGTSINGSGVKYLQRLKNLQEVSFANSPINDDGLYHIASLEQLKVLDLSNTDITDVSMEHIQSMWRLRELNLSGTKITDDGLRLLARLTDLRILRLSNTAITDTGLAHIRELKQLEQLDLAETKVGDHGLEHLKELSSLKTLNIKGTSVSLVGRNHFKELPQFKAVEFDNPTITFSIEY